ncbi:enoyl-CoA hydratase/isomerase family protein [Marinobacterium sp. AK62]|uniref:3-hydroxyisobutyryl-CoA hydrolase n=1 Tax=Marinobacterium alkalitolerans TaxID=1542925 RepID=A0ABS3ZD90_9GAMM|nr:enoyl-CoA hydratase/isomerase family protein [Marinobacterium alkalitolerans]MBP0049669.1 enoyl-CoA hydratase/isomerase family protein [Marinobacterium alkalitolerans]
MSCVLFSEHATKDGQIIGEIRLNAEKSLNALTLDMIDLMQPKLDVWRDDPNVVAVLLDSEGDKAFCAGGDIVNLYKSMAANDTDFPEQFFTREYRLDYTLHTYPKPIICWGSGIVMGGGMGLMNGCSHRVVTETSHLAMPEVTIGLYPDVGGSWFLNRMPGGTGLFLGLTGNPINAVDALYLGLADRALTTDMREGMLQRLQNEHWGEDAGGVVSRVLRELEDESRSAFDEMAGPIRAHEALIREVTDHDSVEEMVEALLAIESDDKWVKRAQKAISHGSPLSIKMIHEQLHRCRHMSLKEVFQHELILSVQCCRHGELQEGVRALLIDKDGQPKWTFDSVEKVDPAFLEGLFKPLWDTHPLADL